MSVITNSVLPLLVSLIEDKAQAVYRDQVEDHENGLGEYAGYGLTEEAALTMEKQFIINQLQDDHSLSEEDVRLLEEGCGILD